MVFMASNWKQTVSGPKNITVLPNRREASTLILTANINSPKHFPLLLWWCATAGQVRGQTWDSLPQQHCFVCTKTEPAWLNGPWLMGKSFSTTNSALLPYTAPQSPKGGKKAEGNPNCDSLLFHRTKGVCPTPFSFFSLSLSKRALFPAPWNVSETWF